MSIVWRIARGIFTAALSLWYGLASAQHEAPACRQLAEIKALAKSSLDEFDVLSKEIQHLDDSYTPLCWGLFMSADEREAQALSADCAKERGRIALDLAVALQGVVEQMDPQGPYYLAAKEGVEALLLDGTEYLDLRKARPFLLEAKAFGKRLYGECLQAQQAGSAL